LRCSIITASVVLFSFDHSPATTAKTLLRKIWQLITQLLQQMPQFAIKDEVGFATWLNPNAAFLIFLLKLCFQILAILQERSHPQLKE
jgi:hypothetical protein